jgi:toxin-antitoxin system PIN domain toxin
MRSLLDVNLLIAVLDPDHAHHRRARDWFRGAGADGWASCPLTQNGCIRIMAQPGYPNPLPPSAVIERLARAARHPRHEFWPDDVSLLDDRTADPRRIHGARRVTDIYLLALAVAHGGRLATFDGTVPLSTVPEALSQHLVVV